MTYNKSTIVFEPIPTNPRFINRAGQSFNRMTFLGFAGYTEARCAQWWCECQCGNIKKVSGKDVVRGSVMSCGCYRDEQTSLRFTTHGERPRTGSSPEYTAFYNAKSRCTDPSVKNYNRYGGRGIKFLFGSFEEFLADVGRRPSTAHSLDRKNNNGNYEKGNVHWATETEQALNKSNNVYLTHEGVTLRAIEWTQRLDIKYSSIINRKLKGWCDECTLTLPKRTVCPHKPTKIQKELVSIADLTSICIIMLSLRTISITP